MKFKFLEVATCLVALYPFHTQRWYITGTAAEDNTNICLLGCFGYIKTLYNGPYEWVVGVFLHVVHSILSVLIMH